MNITVEMIVWSVMLGIIIFLLGTQVGRIYGRREMRELIATYDLVIGIWKSITIETFKRYDTLLREYFKLAKE